MSFFCFANVCYSIFIKFHSNSQNIPIFVIVCVINHLRNGRFKHIRETVSTASSSIISNNGHYFPCVMEKDKSTCWKSLFDKNNFHFSSYFLFCIVRLIVYHLAFVNLIFNLEKKQFYRCSCIIQTGKQTLLYLFWKTRCQLIFSYVIV